METFSYVKAPSIDKALASAPQGKFIAGGTTLVDLVHENVEDSDYDGTDEGWDIYYLGAIKRMLEARGAGSEESKRKPASAKTARPAAKKPKAQVARKRMAGSRSAPKRATKAKSGKTAPKTVKRAARSSKRRSKG